MNLHRDRQLATARRRRPWIFGVCTLAVALSTPLRAEAGQHDAPPPTLPDESTPTSEPDVQGDPTSAPSMAGGPSADSTPPAPAPTRADDRLSLEGRTLWDGLEGKRINLDLKNGNDLAGTVVAQDANNLAFARLSDGMIVSVPKSEIVGVRVRPQQPSVGPAGYPVSSVPISQRPRDSGRSAYAGGVAMLVLGIPLGISGTVMLGIAPGAFYIHLPLLLPGIGLIAGGSVALKRGKERNKAFRQAWGIPMASRMRLAPTLALGRSGGEIGFTLQF